MHSANEVTAELRSRIAKAMYMDPSEIGDDELFSNFGLESVTLARIVQNLCAAYGCEIAIGEFLRRQTVRDASSLICERLAAQAHAKPRSTLT